MANDILEVLTEDHRRVEGIIEALEKESDPNECLSLLNDLSMELVAHMRGEERVLYPRVKKEASGRELEDDAEEQHAVAEELLGELVGMASSGGDGAMQGFSEKLGQLKMAIEQHVTMEEGDMFDLCREIFSEDDLSTLATEIEEVKLEVQGSVDQLATGATFQPPAGAEGTQPSA